MKKITWSEDNCQHSGQLITDLGEYKIISCDLCGFNHAIPIPSVDFLEDFYHKKYYEQDRKVDYFERQNEQISWWNSVFIDRCKEFENIIGKKGSILDIGCGPGFFLKEAEKNGWKVTGIEPSKKAYEYAKNTLNLEVLNSNIEKIDSLGFEEESFDVIYSHGVLEHMRKPNLFFQSAFKFLKKGGIVFYSVANDYNKFQKIYVEEKDVVPWWVVPPEHMNYFSIDSAESISVRNNFKLISTKTTFPIDIFLMMGMNYINIPNLGKDCHKLIMDMEKRIKNSKYPNLFEEINNAFRKIGIGRQIEITARVDK